MANFYDWYKVVNYRDHPYDIKGQEHADLRIYRTFKSNWNTICLPISLTEEQIKKAFGENTVIAEFVNVVKANVLMTEMFCSSKTTHDWYRGRQTIYHDGAG